MFASRYGATVYTIANHQIIRRTVRTTNLYENDPSVSQKNLYRPRVLAVKKTIERTLRGKVLGLALYCVRSNPSLVWLFLLENLDAFVRSEEDEDEETSNSEVPVAVAAVVVATIAGSKRKH
jgi:hypothetical protein